ncbi:MAG: SDR family oxidoreductase [Coriobacteriia bacterium]|nr:SDR family oxidoreductase [Coriobacteriia bacterium]
METAARDNRLVLVNAATGYIGSQLLVSLASAGHRVRASARSPEKVKQLPEVEVVRADAMDAAAVAASMAGVDTAYYLVHTLGGGAGYVERDRQAAGIFAEAAREAGVSRIVYLGGLGDTSTALSEHLASRQEVGRVLASTGVEVIEFRASIVIGTGSTSFEMIRNLVEKLPAMTTPRWVRMDAQPIAISDVLAYLTAAVDLPARADPHTVYEIGGTEIVSYSGLLRLYAASRGLRRLIIPVPVLSPGLSGWWLYLFTPKEATVGRQLTESLRFPTVVSNDAAARDFPQVRPIGATEAIARTFAGEDESFAETAWSDEFRGRTTPISLVRAGRYVDSRTIHTGCPPEAAFDPIACIGGERGWYAFDTLWDIRGFFDILVGGPGHRRGRRDQYALVEGDYLEWWRVETVRPPRLLRLHAEMRLPGAGWLQYEIEPLEEGALVRQTAIFHAKGVLGRAYWYLVLPFHHFVFEGTLKGIDRECRALVEGPNTCPLPGAYGVALDKRRSAEQDEAS